MLVIGPVIGKSEEIQILSLRLTDLIADRHVAGEGIVAGLAPDRAVRGMVAVNMDIGGQPETTWRGTGWEGQITVLPVGIEPAELRLRFRFRFRFGLARAAG